MLLLPIENVTFSSSGWRLDASGPPRRRKSSRWLGWSSSDAVVLSGGHQGAVLYNWASIRRCRKIEWRDIRMSVLAGSVALHFCPDVAFVSLCPWGTKRRKSLWRTLPKNPSPTALSQPRQRFGAIRHRRGRLSGQFLLPASTYFLLHDSWSEKVRKSSGLRSGVGKRRVATPRIATQIGSFEPLPNCDWKGHYSLQGPTLLDSVNKPYRIVSSSILFESIGNRFHRMRRGALTENSTTLQ